MLFLLPQTFPFLLPSNLSPPKTLLKRLKSQQGFKKKKGVIWGVSQPDEKVKGKRVQPSANANPSKDALTIEDMVSKANAAESKSRIDSKKNSHQSKTQIQGFSFVFVIFVMALCF